MKNKELKCRYATVDLIESSIFCRMQNFEGDSMTCSSYMRGQTRGEPGCPCLTSYTACAHHKLSLIQSRGSICCCFKHIFSASAATSISTTRHRFQRTALKRGDSGSLRNRHQPAGPGSSSERIYRQLSCSSYIAMFLRDYT